MAGAVGAELAQATPFWRAVSGPRNGFAVEPLLFEDVREARSLAALVDPFDRLVAGVAVRLDYPLITNDERILDSGLVPTVW